MGKEEVEAAIATIEGTISTIDTLVLWFAAAVAIGVAGELVLGVAHWTKDREIRPLRAEQARLHAVELASLGVTTETMRTANLKLEAQIAPRRLDQKQSAQIAADLAKFSGKKVRVLSHTADVESAILGAQVLNAFALAGLIPIDRRMTMQSFGAIGVGILVSGDNQALADAIVVALSKHLDVARGLPPQGGPTIMSADPNPETPDAIVFVGVKPIQQ